MTRHVDNYNPFDSCPNCGADDDFGATGIVSGPISINDHGDPAYRTTHFGPELVVECHNCETVLIHQARLADGSLVPDLTVEVLSTLYEWLEYDSSLDTAPDEVLEAMDILAKAVGATPDWAADYGWFIYDDSGEEQFGPIMDEGKAFGLRDQKEEELGIDLYVEEEALTND